MGPDSRPVVGYNLFETITEGLVAWFVDLVNAPLGQCDEEKRKGRFGLVMLLAVRSAITVERRNGF